MPSLVQLERDIPACTRCTELRDYCTNIGREKRKAYANWDYWARPVPGFGDRRAKVMILGLAPAAHGANRTGRMFTGDRSGDFLYAALHRAGLANQPNATDRDDGLRLTGVYITAALRCAPPANRPTSGQLAHCASWLDAEYLAIRPRVIFCLGSIAWHAALRLLERAGLTIPRPRPKFTHAREVSLDHLTLLGCYHVSQQNTFTGRLTESMIDAVLSRATSIHAATTGEAGSGG